MREWPALSAPSHVACWISWSCTGQVFSANPWPYPCPLSPVPLGCVHWPQRTGGIISADWTKKVLSASDFLFQSSLDHPAHSACSTHFPWSAFITSVIVEAFLVLDVHWRSQLQLSFDFADTIPCNAQAMALNSSFVACPCFTSCSLPFDVGTTTVMTLFWAPHKSAHFPAFKTGCS